MTSVIRSLWRDCKIAKFATAKLQECHTEPKSSCQLLFFLYIKTTEIAKISYIQNLIITYNFWVSKPNGSKKNLLPTSARVLE